MTRERPAKQCLTYVPVPHLGWGWVQACVSILEAFPHEVLRPTLVLPRSFKKVASSVTVKEAIPRPIPYRRFSRILQPLLDYRFKRELAAADPRHTVVDFWPAPPAHLARYARRRGFLTVRESLNTWCGTAKAILDEAFDRLHLPRGHHITNEMAAAEKQELEDYDYVFSPSPGVYDSLIKANVAPGKILNSSFGWSPSQFKDSIGQRTDDLFRALFVGIDPVRKGVPQLLEAWRRSGIAGELLIVGLSQDARRGVLAAYREIPGVRFEDFTSDLGKLYKSVDVFVFPSLEEGDPQVTYHAAGCGLPVIATPMGAGNIIKDGRNGLVVKPLDVDGLAQAIARLAGSPDLRRRLGAQAALDAQEFTYERVGAARAGILRNLLDAKTDASGG